jgi:predicted aconitase with swiveling domain
MASELRGHPLVAGDASGQALPLPAGLSFAMGFDPVSGRIADPHGGAGGVYASGRVLVMHSGRGSSSASTALAEAIRLDTAPAAIVLSEVDEILAVGAMVGKVLYRRTCPIVVIPAEQLDAITAGQRLHVRADGRVSTDG